MSHAYTKTMSDTRGTQIPGAGLPGRLNVRWHLTFVGSEYGTSLMPYFRYLDFGKFVGPCPTPNPPFPTDGFENLACFGFCTAVEMGSNGQKKRRFQNSCCICTCACIRYVNYFFFFFFDKLRKQQEFSKVDFYRNMKIFAHWRHWGCSVNLPCFFVPLPCV